MESKGFAPIAMAEEYCRIGRDSFLEVLKEHLQASDTELKKIYKELTKKKK